MSKLKTFEYETKIGKVSGRVDSADENEWLFTQIKIDDNTPLEYEYLVHIIDKVVHYHVAPVFVSNPYIKMDLAQFVFEHAIIPKLWDMGIVQKTPIEAPESPEGEKGSSTPSKADKPLTANTQPSGKDSEGKS